MINETVVGLSRLQFAATAMYHFLFVPLTLGLSFILAIMESVYVMTGREVYINVSSAKNRNVLIWFLTKIVNTHFNSFLRK